MKDQLTYDCLVVGIRYSTLPLVRTRSKAKKLTHQRESNENAARLLLLAKDIIFLDAKYHHEKEIANYILVISIEHLCRRCGSGAYLRHLCPHKRRVAKL